MNYVYTYIHTYAVALLDTISFNFNHISLLCTFVYPYVYLYKYVGKIVCGAFEPACTAIPLNINTNVRLLVLLESICNQFICIKKNDEPLVGFMGYTGKTYSG